MLKAPFPWFGGKSSVAAEVWDAFGGVSNYVEPFFGSGAVLLARPAGFSGPETVNDRDGFIANFYRAIQSDPEAVAHHADWPVNENDLHARHARLVYLRADLTAKLEGDPAYFDAEIAGWWVWGACAWIGSGWCSGVGPWVSIDGKLINRNAIDPAGIAEGQGINRQLPHIGNAGQGINRKLPHIGRRDYIMGLFATLAERLRDVRVCCGDWSRIVGTSATTTHPGITGVFLDPPYSEAAGRDGNIYACEDLGVAHDVREWCIANGDNPRLRIALCGYDGEHDLPSGWVTHEWKATGGYGKLGDGKGKENRHRERIWFSQSCLSNTLF